MDFEDRFLFSLVLCDEDNYQEEHGHMDNRTTSVGGVGTAMKAPETSLERQGDLDDNVILQLRAFGTLPVVRTVYVMGSKCDVLEWCDPAQV